MVNKVNEFELALDQNHINDEWNNFVFGREFNEWYNYTSADDLLNNLKDLKEMILDFISRQTQRLSYLDSYTKGMNYAIMHRKPRNDKRKADYRCRHNYGDYISRFCSGYIFGKPTKVQVEDEKENIFIQDLNTKNSLDALNLRLAYDVSTFGRAYEIHYRNNDDEDKIALSSVFETFLIYDLTVEHKKIAGVRTSKFRKKDRLMYKIFLYTHNRQIEFELTDLHKENDLVIVSQKAHFYEEVPIIEWKNGWDRYGDFETSISQIDLYDAAQSDTSNYMHDLNDALLVIKGDLKRLGLTMDNMSEEKKKLISSLRDDNILMLYTGVNSQGEETNVDAEYLYKQYDVAGTEAYKQRLDKDIHKLTSTPDLTDENFSGNQSGIAMQYKTYGLSLKIATKMSEFERCLKNRYKLINNLHKNINENLIDIDQLTVTFILNFPEDVWGEIESFVSVGGEISNKTLLDKLNTVKSTDEELQRLEEEKENDPYKNDFENLKGAMLDEEE